MTAYFEARYGGSAAHASARCPTTRFTSSGGVESIARRGLSCGSWITLHSLILVVESGDDGGLEERGEARIPGLYRILKDGSVCLFLRLRQPRSGPKDVDNSNRSSVFARVLVQ